MKESKVIRILPKEGTQNVNVNIEQDFDYLEVLSLKILQKDAYRIFCSDKGVLVGKVTANGGFPIQNAKISLFIPIDNEDIQNPIIRDLYPFTTPNDTLPTGKRYNLLPRDKQLSTPADHIPVGTFPSKYDIMSNPNLTYIHEKYYKYTTTSNENGDYMFFGIPSGTQIVHCDVDISDIGTNSVTPADLINLGYSPFLFNSDTQFKNSNDLNQLAQIVGLNNTAYINPFWGDPDQCEFGLTRLDFFVSRFVNPKAYLIGSFYTDKAEGISNSFVPSACWQESATGSASEQGCRYGVSRIVEAGSLRTPRQVAASGEVYGRKGIIEAVRLNEDAIPEYVGKWKTDVDGNFIIPLPLNLGKKVWDEDLQGWRDDEENGVATYADYRFKFYFEGQSDFSETGLPQVQLESTLNRGVIFSPNLRSGNQNVGVDGVQLLTQENNFTFYAEPVYGPVLDYEYNMFDQFGLRIKEFSNYARIRMAGFYTVGQNFNYVADYDSQIQDTAGGWDGQAINPVWWEFNQTQQGGMGLSNFYGDNAFGDPTIQNCAKNAGNTNNGIGTNPWIISRSYVFTDLYSSANITSRNYYPTNYMFANSYRKASSKQDELTDYSLQEYGGFISNYTVNRRVEASYKGLGHDVNMNYTTIINGAGDPSNGHSVDINTCDNLPSSAFRYGELITDTIDTTVAEWWNQPNMDNCVGCLTFGSVVKSGNYSSNLTNNGSWYNEEAAPYYGQDPSLSPPSGFSKIDPLNTIGAGGTNSTITGNIMMGGFVAPYAASYELETTLITTCTNGQNDWIVVGLSYCDATVDDCNSNGNWKFSGRTAYYGNTDTNGILPCGTLPGIAPVNFNPATNGVGPAAPSNGTGSIPSWYFGGNADGKLSWRHITLKEGMGVRVTVRPSSAGGFSPTTNTNNGNNRVGICYWCGENFAATNGACAGKEEVSYFMVKDVSRGKVAGSVLTEVENRYIEEPINGSLYFPQYYVGEDESECCSLSNTKPTQRWNNWDSLTLKNRTENWRNNSLLYAGTYEQSSSTEYRYYNDSVGDPLGGQVITNGKYYTLNTVGETKIVEITKDIPNFQEGVNQWSSLDRDIPSSSAHPTDEMNALVNTRPNDGEDFDTNGNDTGLKYKQHKYFVPYDNLLFRTSQQWPRDEDEDGTGILCPEWAIPAWYDWTTSTWSGNLLYPVQNPYNPLNHLSYSNYHIFRVKPTDMTENPSWKPWMRRIAKNWYDENSFWWSSIQPIGNTDYLGNFNSGTSIWGNGTAFDNDKGADNAEVEAYPLRRYYYFSVFHNLSPAETLKRILGYKTGLI